MASIKRIVSGSVCAITAIIVIVLSNGNVRTSERGLGLIGNAESCRRDPYVCPAGTITDGVGNTHNVISGIRKTDVQIAADWEKNILDAESCVIRYASGNKLPQGAFDAATSITFNVGCPTMQKSTMFQQFRAANILAACEQFPRWIYGGGKRLPGLVVRRNQERLLCLNE